LLLCFVFLIPLSAFLSLRTLIALLVLALVFNYRQIYMIFRQSLDIVLFFLVLLFGLIHTQDYRTGFGILETSISLLIMPIALSQSGNFTEEELRKVIGAFMTGLFLACMICLINAGIQFLKSGDSQNFFFYNFTTIIKSHPTYLAYYLIFSITFALDILFFDKLPGWTTAIPGVILFFFCMLLLTGGQTAFISLLLVFSFFVLKFFLEKQTGTRVLTVILICVMIVSMFVLRATESNFGEGDLNDAWDRLTLWESAIAANSNPLLGEGTGDFKSTLNNYYNAYGMKEFADESLNSHNQFVQMYLSHGIIGFIVLIVLLSRPLYLAFTLNDSFGILIFFPFLIYGMTEVFFGRYQGVVFFALLHRLFISHYVTLKPSLAI
jgi:O-antigen ligase